MLTLSWVLTVLWPWLLTFIDDGMKIQRAPFDFCLFSPLTPQIITDFVCKTLCCRSWAEMLELGTPHIIRGASSSVFYFPLTRDSHADSWIGWIQPNSSTFPLKELFHVFKMSFWDCGKLPHLSFLRACESLCAIYCIYQSINWSVVSV